MPTAGRVTITSSLTLPEKQRVDAVRDYLFDTGRLDKNSDYAFVRLCIESMCTAMITEIDARKQEIPGVRNVSPIPSVL